MTQGWLYNIFGCTSWIPSVLSPELTVNVATCPAQIVLELVDNVGVDVTLTVVVVELVQVPLAPNDRLY